MIVGARLWNEAYSCLVFCCKHVQEHIWLAALGNAKEETKSHSWSLKSPQLDPSLILTKSISSLQKKKKHSHTHTHKKILFNPFCTCCYWCTSQSSQLPQLPLSIPASAPSPSPPAEYPQPTLSKTFHECAHLSLLFHCLPKRMSLRFMSEAFNMLREGRRWC